MNRSERVSAITQVLCSNPNKDFPLSFFTGMFDCAKSSISEDLKIVRTAFEAMGTGTIVTAPGAKGGVRYVPGFSEDRKNKAIDLLISRLQEPGRYMEGGFLYTADVMFDPEIISGIAEVFADRFADTASDAVVTVETKGIGVAVLTAKLLGIPLVVIRREARITDGTTLSINYYSGSSGRIQKMTLSKRALQHGSRVIVLDDFIRRGGSIAGMREMLNEFDSVVTGVGVVMTAGRHSYGEYENFVSIINIDDSGDSIRIEKTI